MSGTIRTIYGKPVKKFRHAFDATNVTTAAWVELISAMDKASSSCQIYNGSGSILKLSTGGIGLEDSNEVPYYVLPNGSTIIIPIELAFGGRLSAKAIGADATVGDLILNFMG